MFRQIRRSVLMQERDKTPDGQLLQSFIETQDEAAFAALARRHGPMVLGVCRRVVRDHHDAEDAFQATFLVLALKATSVRPRERVANWLHGVAYRTALKARARAAKRRARERTPPTLPDLAGAPSRPALKARARAAKGRARERPLPTLPDLAGAAASPPQELRPLLDRELHGLPEIYRLPILLCDLEGQSLKETAAQLGWPQGTV